MDKSIENPYEQNADVYLEFVDKALADESSLLRLLLQTFERLLKGRIGGARVLDVACGEGYLARHLAHLGPRHIVGVDSSSALIQEAQRRSQSTSVIFHVDDAEKLSTLSDASFDVAVSQMALMDVADHAAMFRAVRRVLEPDGLFAVSLLHPCFETPFQVPDSQFMTDEHGSPVAHVIRRYATEGFWQSGGEGVRGHMGAHHRMLSTYVNDLLLSGFHLERIEEPVLPHGGLESEVPRVMVMVCSPV